MTMIILMMNKDCLYLTGSVETFIDTSLKRKLEYLVSLCQNESSYPDILLPDNEYRTRLVSIWFDNWQLSATACE